MKRGQMHLWVLTTLLALLLPQYAAATYVDETYNYMVTLNGSNTIRIQVPCYDQKGTDCWVDNGNLKVTWTDAKNVTHTETAFHWYRDGETDSDSKDIYIHFSTSVGGSFDVTQGNTNNYFTLTKASGEVTRLVYRNNDGSTYNVTAVWRLPYDMLGCTLKFSWDVHRKGNWRDSENVAGLNDVTIAMPAAQDVITPQVTTASMAYSEAGNLEIPWFIGSSDITAARYEFTDHNGQTVSETLPKNENSGTIKLDATVPHDNFHVIVSYKDNNGYLIENISSAVQNLTMIHAPMGLSATPLGDHNAAVQLAWGIQYPGTADMMDTDYFEVQRSMTGGEEDFVTIGTEPFVFDGETYTYVDSLLVDAVVAELLQQGGTLDKLTYRVRRMCTQNWGWVGNNCATSTTCVVDDLHLMRIANYTAKWEDERAFTVRVAWEYADEPNAVWDDRAKMIMRISSTNAAGETVETNEYELTPSELDARYKIVSFTRSCVDYKIEMFTQRGTSPIPLYEEVEPYYFPIRNEANWNTFCLMVASANGNSDVNARLYADINVTNGSFCGTSSAPYRGHFDGNGHTFTANYSGGSNQAPFHYVKGATIKNLKVNGTVSVTNKFAASIVANITGGTNVIEGCSSTATIHSDISGDATNGGLVAVLNGGTLVMTNCYFAGKMTGTNCHSNAGFVGYLGPGTEATLSNCIFDPEELSTKRDGCATYARVPATAKLTLVNCFNNVYYDSSNLTKVDGKDYMLITTTEDWNKFVARVEAAQGKSEVNAIMDADITVDKSCAESASYPFRGTFNGNGHTLTANINGGTSSYVAPFSHVMDCTIKNLTVRGEINGGIHSAGLIGTCEGTANVTLEKLVIFNTVRCTSDHVGGVIGHTHDANIVMEDCKSFGYLYATGNDTYGGAVMGWGHYGLWTLHRVYEYVTFNNCTHQAFSYWYDTNATTINAWGYNSKSTTCVSYNNFDHVKAEYRNVNNDNSIINIMNGEKSGSWKKGDNQKAVPVMEVSPIGESEMTTDELLALIGSGWKKEGDKVVPLTTTVNYAVATIPTPELPTFHHENIGKIGKTLKTETRHSSVLLAWETDGNPVDYFTVYRRLKGGKDTDWEPVKSDIDQLSYEDKTVSPLEDYEYKVRATNDCEGISYTETNVKEGACKHSGMVEGYVRFNDGTGVPGISVEIAYDGTVVATVTTDESGYYEAEGLSYKDLQSITYSVTPVATGGISLEVESYPATFNNKTNHAILNEFTVTNGLQFNAYVMYDGTSIPVKGARFRVNGELLHNAKGDFVETDFEGHVQFQVMNNTRNKIQAVMDGHKFVGDGWYKSEEGVILTDKVGQAYFYDSTLVKLTGRVVGGKDQGELPLDNNLSKNNLGDDLTMVLALEGDNTSWLVYDNLNPTQTKRNVTFQHPAGGGHKTQVEVQRKRMVVKPDSVTGEYVLMLPPVRWKVQQVYCEGYSTLFQDGMVGEVIDLTDCLSTKDSTYTGTFTDVDKKVVYQPTESYNYRYNRIYHAPVEITYKQLGYDTFDYFGDKSYLSQTIGGAQVEVPLAYLKTEDGAQAGKTSYTFGHPMFSLERRYPIQISVIERYPWNGVKGSLKEDQVRIGGGKVTIHNGMKNGLHQDTLRLDSLGQGLFYIEAEQTTRLLTGDDALRTVTMTLEQDGTTYEAEPLKGYILNMFATSDAKDVIATGQPLLVDILRDPPGGNSTATLAKGSKLKYSYTLDMKFKAGLTISFSKGTKLENFQGAVAAPEGAGTVYGIINAANTVTIDGIDYGINGEGHRAFSYTMNVNEDITTSSDHNMVGADADLYIGLVQNMVVTPMSTIRAIPDSIYRQMAGRLGNGKLAGITSQYGTLVHIAEGRDAKDSLYHLVRDESLGYGPKVTSSFIHSQKHIITQIVPELIKECRDLMFIGTSAEAQKLADATGKPVYRALVSPESEDFGTLNAKDGDPYYYTSTMPEEPGMNYVIHLPNGTEGTPKDEVAEKCQIIMAWLNMISENEHEKLTANDLVANYDVDGGSTLNYSENFESEYSISNYLHMPGIISGSYFDNCWADKLLGIGGMVGLRVANIFIKKIWGRLSTNAKGNGQGPAKNGFETSLLFTGQTFRFSILPVLEYDVKDTSGETNSYSRKESFHIAMDKKSHLNFDVFHAKTHDDVSETAAAFDVFTNNNFNNMVEYTDPYLRRNLDMKKAIYSRGFVYRTRGGATCNPWESDRHSMFYQEGSILDERTKKICNPKITLDRQSISGVAVGDPARFKVYLTNDSEMPEAATGSLSIFNLHLNENTNPNGAKIYVDGTPLNSSGIDVMLNPGQVVQKTIEVYAGDQFDYEGLQLGLFSSSDWEHVYDNVKFDVHYLRMAGPVNISTPGDKWIMNTEAQWNDKRGWFMPVTIDGFNKYQHNFDHIEFQYKESQRGDEYWTNLCSYYADSTLMAQANGVCEMIPENGNIVTEFYGEGTVMEKAYDLRAVLYCRDGNSFLTTSSKIISGVKDTRRPQLFGLPEPKDGILSAADNIVFNFSEDIEYNYLNTITNFEVKGEVNNDNVSESVSVEFTGKASLESEAQRNFSGKSVTIDLMVKPAATDREMPIFSHGTNGKKLQLWVMPDYKLKAIVDDQTFESDVAIEADAFTQVALCINQNDSTLSFFNGGKQIGQHKLNDLYNGTGTLIFGRTNETDRSKSQYYEGRMMEARVWYRALSGGELGTTYGSCRLTGYEMGLVDYYPMNEGSGDYAIDHTQGANMKLISASWAMPRGFSLHLEREDHGLALNEKAISRTKEQDYTLMFWFKTDASGVLVSNGAGTSNEDGAENLFNIAFEGEKLMYRTHGMGVEVPGSWNDNKWHHYVMTVNRSRGVANIYVDAILRTTFSADSLGGISGGYPMIGAALTDVKKDGHTQTTDTRNWLRGNMDELCMFAQALPATLIKSYSTKSPNGDEAGLLTYLSFDRQERQKDNDIVLVAYPYSKRIYKDDQGNVKYELDPLTKLPTSTPVRDYSFDEEVSIEALTAHIDGTTAAPVVPYEELKNLTFSYVGEGHKILVDINESVARINRRNIYVTLRDVEDKNGNTMASPATACYYVMNSSLQWMSNHQTETVKYGAGETIMMTLVNNSSANHTYTIENCPKWLTLDSYSDIISPQDFTTIEATVNKDLNVGTYDEILYLTDEKGISEPFYLNLTVEGEQPDWAWNVQSSLLEYSMNIVGRVYLNDEIDIDSRDIVGAFDQDNVCHGFAHIDYSALTGESGIYMTLYDNKAKGRELRFKLWQYATGRELMLTIDGDEKLAFKNDTIIGTETPVRFAGGNMFVQTFDLKTGWNWVSFNVASEKLSYLNNLLDGLPWQNGDILTDMNSNTTLLYKNGHWLATGDVDNIRLSPRKAYAIKVAQDIKFPIGGSIIKAADTRTLELKNGWNGIGYTPMINLSVETALSDYYDKAEPGDVIKSHDEFAYFTVSGGVGRWRGNLQYMKPGAGYMFLRKGSKAVTFRYPFYEPGSTFIDERAFTSASTSRKAPARSRSTMSLSAMIEGFELEEGDLLVAYADGERVGESLASEAAAGGPIYYLSISGDQPVGIWFAIEREGEIVAATDEVMSYRANAILGSPDEPTAISFVHKDNADGGSWYALNGMRLPRRPMQKGIYIFNGKKVVIK